MNRSWLRQLCFVLVSVTPLIAFAFLQGRNSHYLALLEKYECDRELCEADLDRSNAVQRKRETIDRASKTLSLTDQPATEY